MTLESWRDRIAARLPKSRVARSIIILASGSAAAQAITVCAMPVVTRMYTPSQIGIISLFLAFFSFWSPALSLRYEYALLIARDDAESHVVHRLAATLVGVMSVLALPFLWGLQKTDSLGFGLLPWWAPYVAVPIMFGQGQLQVYRAWGLRAGLMKVVTKAQIERAAANAAGRIGLGLFGGGIPALFIAEVAGAWAALFELRRKLRKHYASSRPHIITSATMKQVAKRFMKFPAYEAPSTWLNQLALALPLPIVASLHGAAAAGWFGLARAMVSIPNAQIGAAVADVFQVELAHAINVDDRLRARGLFYKLLRKLALYGLVPLVGVIFLSPWLVPLVFGREWEAAGYAAAIIAVWLYSGLIVSSLSRVLSVLQVQEYKFVYDVVALLLFTAVYFVGKVESLTFISLVATLAAAGTMSYVVYLVILLFIVESRLGQELT